MLCLKELTREQWTGHYTLYQIVKPGLLYHKFSLFCKEITTESANRNLCCSAIMTCTLSAISYFIIANMASDAQTATLREAILSICNWTTQILCCIWSNWTVAVRVSSSLNKVGSYPVVFKQDSSKPWLAFSWPCGEWCQGQILDSHKRQHEGPLVLFIKIRLRWNDSWSVRLVKRALSKRISSRPTAHRIVSHFQCGVS